MRKHIWKELKKLINKQQIQFFKLLFIVLFSNIEKKTNIYVSSNKFNKIIKSTNKIN
jgi:hypothetical protein